MIVKNLPKYTSASEQVYPTTRTGAPLMRHSPAVQRAAQDDPHTRPVATSQKSTKTWLSMFAARVWTYVMTTLRGFVWPSEGPKQSLKASQEGAAATPSTVPDPAASLPQGPTVRPQEPSLPEAKREPTIEEAIEEVLHSLEWQRWMMASTYEPYKNSSPSLWRKVKSPELRVCPQALFMRLPNDILEGMFAHMSWHEVNLFSQLNRDTRH